MKMKKLLAIGVAALALCMSFALVGCGGGEAADEPAADGAEYALIEDGKLTVAASLDFPPFENLEDGEVVGFEVDLMAEIANRLGLELNYLPTMKFDTIIPAIVAGGTADVGVSGFTITPARLEEVDFTTPVCNTNQCLVVAEGSTVTDIDQLADQRVGAETGTTGLDWAKENIVDASEIIAFDEYPAVFAALQSGQVAAVVLDKPVADFYINKAYPDCNVVKEIPTGEQYGIAVSKDNPELTAAINQAIEDMKADGTFGEIETKWFGSASE